MDKKSQRKSGLKTSKDFSWSDREKMIKEYLSTNQTKQAIWEKYSGQSEEHGQLIKWMRHLGYVTSAPSRRPQRRNEMSKQSKRSTSSTDDSASLELIKLRAQIAALEEQLQDSKLEAIAYRKMISIAEQSLKIKIRKKSNTKPSK